MNIKERLHEQLGGRPAEYLDALSESDLIQLVEAIAAAQKHESETLHDAITKALDVAPRLLRGSLRRVLFPKD